jgi:acyl-CoA dehydrogenase
MTVVIIPSSRLFIIKQITKKYSRQIKIKVSKTERIAMECGDTNWEKSLFSNNLNWSKLLSVKRKSLSKIEKEFIEIKVPELCNIYKQNGLTDKTLKYIKSNGFWSLNIPTKYGGLDFSARAHAKILIKLSSCDTSLAVTVMVPNSLGPAELIIHYGTDQQKQELLPKLATGEEIPCFALTSTDAGSDASAMTDSGVVCWGKHKGNKTLGILLNWDKRYTTLAPIATMIGLAFKTYDPNKLIGNKATLGITCALVDSTLDGISIGKIHHPIGAKFSNGPHKGKDVFIPMSAVIGGQAMVGDGWLMLMECLSLGRGVSLPSLSMAGVAISLKSSIEYSLVRRQFNQPIYRFQGVAEKIVSMASDVLEMDAMSDFHLSLLDQGLNPSISSAILKYNHTELLRNNINRGMDIHGGKTVMLGDKNYLADIYKVIPIAITVEGANILTRSMIIFGQGLMRCHPYLKDEIESLERGSISKLNKLLSNHIGYQANKLISSFWLGLSKGYGTQTPNGINKDVRHWYQELKIISASYAFLVEVALISNGQKIKFQESMNGLFSDLLIKMYGISALLKYTVEFGREYDNLIKWSIEQRMHESQIIISDICQQFKYSKIIKLIALPLGVYRSKPSIKLQNTIINELITNPYIKNTLTSDILIMDKSALKDLEDAYEVALEVEKIYKKIGVFNDPEVIDTLLDKQEISNDEHKHLYELMRLRKKVLEVNDYEN